ncbi:MAG TPA: helix-turn-helix transcriptional regulator [Candidatus Saccharimonadales bacterium]|nr:helix-turn-helix transcriptional regulator [Candidatus Saccharimonadales bacterium]
MSLHPLKKEFIDLYEQSGWSQAEVARQLELTRGGVNGIITGPTVPSLATVKLFQLILASKAPARVNSPSVTSVEDWAKPLLEELKKIDPSQRSHLVAALCEVVRSARKGTTVRGRVPRTD